MTNEAYLAFAGISVVLVLTSGPMVSFLVSSTIQKGRKAGFSAVAGAGIATILQLSLIHI